MICSLAAAVEQEILADVVATTKPAQQSERVISMYVRMCMKT
jgi:hypothetical protein